MEKFEEFGKGFWGRTCARQQIKIDKLEAEKKELEQDIKWFNQILSGNSMKLEKLLVKTLNEKKDLEHENQIQRDIIMKRLKSL